MLHTPVEENYIFKWCLLKVTLKNRYTVGWIITGSTEVKRFAKGLRVDMTVTNRSQ